MSKINVLPQELINIIAAGEVVERPASVVKELIENSIDAESTVITVNIENFGQDLIEVIDNGIGLNEEDALLAFQQHATSKISTKEDLENIMSLGFRGEALASISSVAERAEMESLSDSNPPVLINIESGSKESKQSNKSERGTRISIHNLFKNVPARKKFLKTNNTEFRNIVNTFLEIALINNKIHFELNHNSKLVYRLTSSNSIKERMFEIWGKSLTESFYEEKNLSNIKMLLEKPENSKKNTNFQYIYINDRRIDSKVIQSAVKEAYQGFIHRDLRPSFLIVIHIDPKVIDVNVHPRKLEVRFEDPQSIFRLVYSSVRKALENETKQNIKETIEEIRNVESNFIQDLEKEKISSSNYSSSASNYNYSAPKFSKVQDSISFTREIIPNTSFNYDDISEPVRHNAPSINNLKQIFNTYIVYEKEDEIIFIDQHAAAEKINFERLLYGVGEMKTKPLLLPTVIELKPFEKEIIMEDKVNLSEIGIIIEDFGGNTIQILEIPENLQSIDFNDYLSSIINNKEDFSWIKTEYTDIKLSSEMYNLLALTACHGSIRAGQKLTESEMLNIINDLNKIKQPNNCPHGRPISWKLKRQEIEKNFKRVI